MCDSCMRSQRTEGSSSIAEVDVSSVADSAFQILVQAQSQDSKITALKLLDALIGKGPSKLSKKAVGNFTRPQMESIVAKLLIEGYLKEDFHFTPYNTISYILPGSRSIRTPLNMEILNEGKISPKKSAAKKKKEDVIYVSDSDDDFQ